MKNHIILVMVYCSVFCFPCTFLINIHIDTEEIRLLAIPKECFCFYIRSLGNICSQSTSFEIRADTTLSVHVGESRKKFSGLISQYYFLEKNVGIITVTKDSTLDFKGNYRQET